MKAKFLYPAPPEEQINDGSQLPRPGTGTYTPRAPYRVFKAIAGGMSVPSRHRVPSGPDEE
jgi:hypothetical protein